MLAHTVYQTLIFDGSVRDGGFELQRTWEGRERARLAQEERTKSRDKGSKRAAEDKRFSHMATSEWEGLSEVILGRKEWFDAWLAGEQRCKQRSEASMETY